MVKPAFLPLPIGAVQPQGWLRDWAQSARHGITGHLDEWHPTFADGWKGIPIKAPGADADGTGWPIEQSAYWLDGAIRLGLVLHDDALVKKIRARLDPVVEGVNKAESGTSLIYWKKGYKPQGFDSWAHSQMGRALVALYQGTGDKRVLDALVKVYAEYAANMGHVDFRDVTGLCNLDAMLETYSFSGDRRILDRVLRAVAQPAVAKDFQAWEAGQLPPGHMDIIYEDIRLPAIVYPWTGDEHLLRATLGAWKWLDEQHMQPYGVASGEEYASGIGAFRKTETCDVTSMLLAASWLYRIQGDGDWGDRMERAFFNAGAAPVARDFQTMCYYQSPNRLRSDSLPAAQPHSPGPEGIRFHKLGCPYVLCCVGAVNRIIPNYIIHMWMATRDNGLAATLYGPCTVSALAGDGVPVTISTTTDYPFGETVRMQVEPAKNRGVSALHPHSRLVPGCPDHRERFHDAGDARRQGVCEDRADLDQERLVELRLPMTPRVVRGYETEVPSANRQYFSYRTRRILPAAASALCERSRRPLAVLPAGGRLGPEYASRGCKMAVRAGHRCRAARCRHHGGTQIHARALGLAAGRAGRVESAGSILRLAAKRCPRLAVQAGQGNRLRNHPPRPLRLHQVPYLDVPRDRAGLERGTITHANNNPAYPTQRCVSCEPAALVV